MEINKEFKEIAKPAGFLVCQDPAIGIEWLNSVAVRLLRAEKKVLYVICHKSTKSLRIQDIASKLKLKERELIDNHLKVISEGFVPLGMHVDCMLIGNLELVNDNYFYKYLRQTIKRSEGQVFVVYNTKLR